MPPSLSAARANLAPPRAPLPAGVGRMLEWVLGGPARDPDGCLRSWVGASRPGFRYPEATGFLVGVLLDLHQRTGATELLVEARRAAAVLVAERHPSGGFGREGALYAFDSGVCLAAWTRLIELDGVDGLDASGPLVEAAKGTAGFVRDALAARSAAVREADRAPLAPTRWSVAFGPHQLKAAHALVRAEQLGLVEDAVAPLSAWARRASVEHWHHDHFHWRAWHCASYAHAHCYALEGLLACARDGLALPDARAVTRAGADWLASVQDRGGAIPSWHGASDEPRLRAADATAQAVRIWVVVDRARYADAIERGLAFLASVTDASGGVRYADSCAERSSWATLFTIQAILLARLGPSLDPIA